jgi:hypothetical protein
MRNDDVKKICPALGRLVADAIDQAIPDRPMHFMVLVWDEEGNYSRATDTPDGDAAVIKQLAARVESTETQSR